MPGNQEEMPANQQRDRNVCACRTHLTRIMRQGDSSLCTVHLVATASESLCTDIA
jgi:hypothetical protein